MGRFRVGCIILLIICLGILSVNNRTSINNLEGRISVIEGKLDGVDKEVEVDEDKECEKIKPVNIIILTIILLAVLVLCMLACLYYTEGKFWGFVVFPYVLMIMYVSYISIMQLMR